MVLSRGCFQSTQEERPQIHWAKTFFKKVCLKLGICDLGTKGQKMTSQKGGVKLWILEIGTGQTVPSLLVWGVIRMRSRSIALQCATGPEKSANTCRTPVCSSLKVATLWRPADALADRMSGWGGLGVARPRRRTAAPKTLCKSLSHPIEHEHTHTHSHTSWGAVRPGGQRQLCHQLAGEHTCGRIGLVRERARHLLRQADGARVLAGDGASGLLPHSER